MIGYLIHRDARVQWDNALERLGVEPLSRVRTLIHYELYTYPDERARDLALVAVSLADDLQARKVGDLESRFLRALSNHKSRDIDPAEAVALHRGYSLLRDKEFLGKRNAAAHRAWVTMRLWAALAHADLWTHEVEVSFEIDGERSVVRERAVSPEHARRVAAKVRRAQRERLGPTNDGIRFDRTMIRPLVLETRPEAA
jgi:hypothetical protein